MKKQWAAAFIGLALPAAASAKLPQTSEFFEIRTRPIGAMSGIFGAESDLGLSEHWSLGPSYYQTGATEGSFALTIQEIGANLSWYPSAPRFQDGWEIRAFARYVRVSASQTDVDAGALHNWTAGASGGYHWRLFASGFGVNLGAGIAYYGAPSSSTFTSVSGARTSVTIISASGFQPVLEALIGWAF